MISLAIGLFLVVVWQSATVITIADHAYWLGPRPCDSGCYSTTGLQWLYAAEDYQRNSIWIALPGIVEALVAEVLGAQNRRLANVGLALCIAVPMLIWIGFLVGAAAML